ncbi:MAG: NAD(P)H-dependent oxidoreductase [Chloroflexi bacterium]|nr:NAD(P)H-dependent oxidoreductase [Chloroflexota bacterium]
MTIEVLVLHDDRGRLMGPLAQGVAEGVARVPGAHALVRPIDQASRDDLARCHALVLGSPNWSGITGKLKLWLDSLSDLWEDASLAGKVGAAFTGGASRSAGTEFTLLTLVHWMLANGLIIVGLPWNTRMVTSGSYYGATGAGEVVPGDVEQARALGERVARVAQRLAQA